MKEPGPRISEKWQISSKTAVLLCVLLAPAPLKLDGLPENLRFYILGSPSDPQTPMGTFGDSEYTRQLGFESVTLQIFSRIVMLIYQSHKENT